MQYLRTPDERFAGLPDFPWAPRYVELPGGPRVAAIDEGPRDARCVVMLHSGPAWSFAWRKVIRAVTAKGWRAVAPDLVGFGRSDKPARRRDHTFDKQVGWLRATLAALDVPDAVLIAHGWGGTFGLHLLVDEPERWRAVLACNLSLATGEYPLPPDMLDWREFCLRTPQFPVGAVIARGCWRPVRQPVIDAYDAPFPEDDLTSGPRALPQLAPAAPDEPTGLANRRTWAVLERWTRPFRTCFGDSDPILQGGDRTLQARIPGARGQRHITLERAGHWLMEDAGDDLADIVVDYADAYG